MDKKHLLQITNELYRITLLFPKKEPLRYKMRALADDILALLLISTPNNILTKQGLVKINGVGFEGDDPNVPQADTSQKILKEIEVLESFLEVAKNQNWVRDNDISNLQKEYNQLKEKVKNLPKLEKKEAIPSSIHVSPIHTRERVSVSERQEKILEILREKGKAQVWEIKKIFPQVSKRTLRRDFEKLLKKGIIQRVGERNKTFYRLKEGRKDLWQI